MKTVLGQSMFEVVIAIGLMAMVVVGVVILATNSLRNSTFSKNNSSANRYNQEAAEWLRSEASEDWDTFVASVNSCGAACCINTSPLSNATPWNNDACSSTENISGTTIFTRSSTFSCFLSSGMATPSPIPCSDVRVDTVSANLTVLWSDAQGVHSVVTSTQFTNWKDL